MRAQRILDAWEQEDASGLRSELRMAQRPFTASTAEEEERLDLLNGIAAQIEQDLAAMQFGAGTRASTCFRLLAHLAGKQTQRAIQSEKPSSYPYSLSVLKISACH